MLDYVALWERAKFTASLHAAYLYGPHMPKHRKEAEERLTWKYFLQYIKP